MATNLISKADYKAYTGISSINQDVEIDLLIPKVSALVKNYCRQTFVDYTTDPKTETFNGGTSRLYLKESPVLNVYSVEYSSDYGQNYTILTDYVDFIPNYVDSSIDSVNPTGFPYAVNGYVVNYSAGYTDIPEDLKLAVMDLVTYYRKNDGSVHNNKSPGGGGSVQLEYIMNTNFPAHIKRVLDLYVADFI